MEEEEDDASLFITSGSNTTIDSGVLSVDSVGRCIDVELCLLECLGVGWVDVDAGSLLVGLDVAVDGCGGCEEDFSFTTFLGSTLALVVMLLVGGVVDPDAGASVVEFGVDSDGFLP